MYDYLQENGGNLGGIFGLSFLGVHDGNMEGKIFHSKLGSIASGEMKREAAAYLRFFWFTRFTYEIVRAKKRCYR